MTTINSTYLSTLLADATYALDRNINNLGQGDLTLALQSRMTTPLATFISNNFTVVNHIETSDVTGSGFDATVWRGNPNTPYTGKIYVSMQGTQGLQDFLSDIELTFSSADRQLRDMINWWLKITTPEGEMAQQIGLERIDSGQRDAVGKPVFTYEYAEAPPVPGTGLISATELNQGIQVNGHSLGGYLATAFARLFGVQANVTHVSTFNSAGFTPGSEIVFQQLQNLIGIEHGWGCFPNESEQTNFFARNGIHITTNTFWFEQIGQRISIFIEEIANADFGKICQARFIQYPLTFVAENQDQYAERMIQVGS